MNCPVCDGIRMREVEREGVMIDVCPQCKGVWLDRGELDKLMKGVHDMQDELNAREEEMARDGYGMTPPPQPPGGLGTPPPRPEYGTPPMNNGQYGHQPPAYGSGGYRQDSGRLDAYDDRYRSGSDKHGYPYRKKKKKSVLDVFGDLFD
ncbi:zf-TFIIB domain-containing protein [Paenibacillus sp. IB182496]|uniref:Zf-TFIIB domain-containing protein n=1 Tax=Paenibacillus sabuli TaxID=2772509 RepID=A0A927BW13_9BACL|nr:zf-TFIIB domain-containing protein [Paenibacillus sabuli]